MWCEVDDILSLTLETSPRKRARFASSPCGLEDAQKQHSSLEKKKVMTTHLLDSTAFVDGAIPAPIVGQIYRTKQCETLASAIHGQTGWKVIALKNGSPVFDLVVFYGKITPGRWLTLEEQKNLKSERAKAWWTVNGSAERMKRVDRLTDWVRGNRWLPV